MIVDSHCHVSPVWYEPVELLLRQMELNNVDHAVLIQMNGQFDNSYQQECLKLYPGKFSSVVLVDAESPSASEDLKRLVGEGASGVRLRPTTRSRGADPLAIWRTAAELGVAVSCIGNSLQFAADEFAQLVAALPNLPIVVEHLGSGSSADANDAERAARLKAFELSRFPNTYLKFDGLGEFAQRAMPVKAPFPFVEPIPDTLEQALKSFGPNRMMWGSDYPPVSRREGYGNALRHPMARLGSLSTEERDQMFGKVALSVFPIRK